MTALLKDDNSYHSSLREQIIEHLFISEILKNLWLAGRRDIEVSKSEVDKGGYDIIMECNGVIRHIQLKSSSVGSKTANQKISLSLTSKPSGCVVWVFFNPYTMHLGPFLWFGAAPGCKIPDLLNYKIARHTKGNAGGYKAERPNHRIVPKGNFKKLGNPGDLVLHLFGVLK